MLSGMRETNEIPDGERAMVQDFVNQTYNKFKSVVQTGRDNAYGQNKDSPDKDNRGQQLSTNWTNYADGRILSGDRNVGTWTQ